MGVFHEYDIRGIYPSEIDKEFALKLGNAVSIFLKKHNLGTNIVIGRDGRTSSPELSEELIKSCAQSGLSVSYVGICTTPSLYYMSKFHDAGIMITASHNKKKYNGFKMVLHGNQPLGYADGLKEIEELMDEKIAKSSIEKVTTSNIDSYINRVQKTFKNIDFSGIKVVVDSSNGVGGITFPKIFKKLGINYFPIFLELDGNFPNHDPDPSKEENLKELKSQVIRQKADIGIAFDGDADRLVVVDEKGEILNSSIVAKMIAKHYMHLGGKFVLDLRLSKSVAEYIQEKGGEAIRSRVGHVNVKKLMREIDASAGMEMSGHYMHKVLNNIDDGVFSALVIINELKNQNQKMSEIHQNLKKYNQISANLEVEDKDKAIDRIKEFFFTARMEFLDGISLFYSDWWANIRKSNTENILRVSIEANDKLIAEQKYNEIRKLILQN